MLSENKDINHIVYEKYIGVLDEARSHPELNPKIDLFRELDYIDSRQNSDNSVFVSFTSVPKFGANPRSEYDTPLGIYAYPLKYVIKKEGAVEYQADAPYLQVFKAKNFINVTQLGDWKDKILNSLNKSFKLSQEDFALYKDNKKLRQMYVGLSEGKKIWYSMYEILKKYVKTNVGVVARKILRDAGIKGIVDNGTGTIHKNEPTQAVFFELNELKLISQLNNRGTLKSTLNVKKSDTRQKEMKAVAERQKLQDEYERIIKLNRAAGSIYQSEIFKDVKTLLRETKFKLKIQNAAIKAQIGRLYPELKSVIASNIDLAVWWLTWAEPYGPFPEAEPLIAKYPEHAVFYAKITKKRFLAAEPFIAKDPEWAFFYARDVLKGKFPLADTLLKSSKYSEKYNEL